MDETILSNTNGSVTTPVEGSVEEEQTLEAGNQVETENSVGKRSRLNRPYPMNTFQEALELALAIQQYASGKQVRRTTLFNSLNKSPESSGSRTWVTSASRYGLVKGSSSSEFLELTEEGKIASGDEYSQYEQVEARANLAILHVPIFRSFFDELVGNKFPARQFLEDLAKKYVPEQLVKEALDIFIVNAKFVGLLRVMSGVERLVPIDQLLELTSVVSPLKREETSINDDDTETAESVQTPTTLPSPMSVKTTLDEICFYVTPIGEPGSEQRQHADLFLNYIIQPALEGTGLKVLRADKIDRPGVIGSQIIRHLLRSKLVIVDLSFHNPNVFYELAIRHVTRLPTIHIMRAMDSIPFDLNQMRTIKIDTSSIYALVPQLDTYKAEIAIQVRRALDGEETSDNPISVFYPNFKAIFD